MEKLLGKLIHFRSIFHVEFPRNGIFVSTRNFPNKNIFQESYILLFDFIVISCYLDPIVPIIFKGFGMNWESFFFLFWVMDILEIFSRMRIEGFGEGSSNPAKSSHISSHHSIIILIPKKGGHTCFNSHDSIVARRFSLTFRLFRLKYHSEQILEKIS